MDKKVLIPKFLSSNSIAVAGVSRNQKKFGYIVFNDLKKKNYPVVPINPSAPEIDGVKCYADAAGIPFEINALLTVIPPAQTLTFLKSLFRNDIKTVWLQPGSESDEVINYCRSAGLDYITGECILMYAKPEGFHNFHRFIKKIFGKLPV